jgi:predicted membrane-bound mannosyltransferase/sugar lactone lactonase YvrE
MEPENKPSSWLDHVLVNAFPALTVERLLIVLVLGLAIFSRFYDVGVRVMSHDETNHVVPAYSLYKGQGYTYDPVTHGPLKFELMALSYFILGDSDFSSRVPAVIFSIGTIVFALFGLRRYVGRVGALAAGFLLLISPIMMFYGRYIRDEALYVFFTLFILWSILRYLETGQKKYLLLLSLGMGLNFVTHEIAFILTAQALLFTGLLFVEQMTRRRWLDRQYLFNFVTALGLTMVMVAVGLAGAILGTQPASTTATPAAVSTATAAPTSFLSTLTPAAKVIVPIALLGFVIFGAAALFFLFKGAGFKLIRSERSFDLLIVQLFLVLPLSSPFLDKFAGFNPMDYSSTGILHSAIFLVPLVAIAISLGLWWNSRMFLRSAAIFYAIYVVFYTTFFTSGGGFFIGLVGSLSYWASQQAVNRGDQPWYYFVAIQIPMYEYLPLIGALLAAVIGLRRRLWVSAPGMPFHRALPQIEVENSPQAEPVMEPAAGQTADTVGDPPEDTGLVDEGSGDGIGAENPDATVQPVLALQAVPVLALFLFWSLTSLIAFSIAGEKMPWLTVNPALGLILSAAWGVGYLSDTTHWERLKANKALLVFLLLVVFVAGLGGALFSLLSSQPPFQGKELSQLQNTSTFLLAAAAVLVSGYFLFKQLAHWVRADIVRAVAFVIFAILVVQTARTAIRASFINYDNAMEFLVYAHGATGSKDILSQVAQISFRTTGGKAINVAYDSDALYPFWWYFRDYPNKVYFTTPTRDLRNSVIVIAGEANYAKVDAILGDAYYKFDYTRLWWPMQDYYNLTWDRIWNAISNPQMRTAVFDIWFNADYTLYGQVTNNANLTLATWQPSQHFRMYVRKDVISQMWSYGVAPSTAPTVTDPYAKGHITLPADFAVGSTGNAPGNFDGPRQFAFAPDGTIYVTDSRNNRIQHITQDGKVLQVWGTYADISKGAAPGGTFNEPWGVAVGPDGSVYVADTFNFRIQKFTADGQFVTMWGYWGQAEKPEAFYGPRGLAIDANGRIFVTDTGNKRVVIFDKDGNYIAQFGSAGADPGQFDEPVGIALDAQGNVYVTDTWNQRMQVFSQDSTGTVFTPIAQWDISGWYGQSLDNKPFVAVDAQQHVFVTDPEASRILEFDNKGTFIRTWGDPGTGLDGIGLASGIALDADGHVWVSDSGNNRLLRYTLPSP